MRFKGLPGGVLAVGGMLGMLANTATGSATGTAGAAAAGAAGGPAAAAPSGARAAEPGTVAHFDPGALVPYFSSGPMAEATQRLRSGDASTAVKLIAELVGSASENGSAATPGGSAAASANATQGALTTDPRARFLLAVAQLRAAQSLAAGPERTTLARRAAQN